MIYEPKTKTYFVTVIPNPGHIGEYVPVNDIADIRLIQRVNHGLMCIQERNIDQIHDLLSPGYGLMIKYSFFVELPDGENQYLYPND